MDRLKSSVEFAAAERQNSERVHRGVEDQLNMLTEEHHRLQTAYCELQRQRDVMSDEKDELMKDVERLEMNNDRWYDSISAASLSRFWSFSFCREISILRLTVVQMCLFLGFYIVKQIA